MKMYDLTIDLISKYLDTRDSITKVIEKIKSEVDTGHIAFYPCSRYANMIVREIKNTEPALFLRVEAFFDKSEEAKSDTGANVYNLKKLSDMKGNISLLVVCSNTFYERELKDLQKISGYNGKMIKTSYFDISVPTQNSDKILSDIEKVYNLLEDRKSRIVYLVTWLSRVLNDVNITYLFESEKNVEIKGKTTKYKNYRLDGLDDLCAQELHAEIYKMRYVYPESGDIVLDIGGYKGDSAIFFADSVTQKGKVFVFEPIIQNYKKLVDNINLNNLADVIIPINKGLSDKPTTMRATSSKSGAPWAFLSESEGNEVVKVTTIDDFVERKALKKLDFIKIDVEGFEYKVLSGGKKTICHFNPKLSIPLYHKSSDLTVLPLLVKELGNYKFYIRCKIEGAFGINLYCKKK